MLRHVGIVVENLERQIAFYVEALDMHVWARSLESGPSIEKALGLPGVIVETVKMRRGDTVIELLNFKKLPAGTASRLAKQGISHVAFTVRDVSAAAAFAEAEGASAVSLPQDTGRARICFIRDPEGNYIELVEEKP